MSKKILILDTGKINDFLLPKLKTSFGDDIVVLNPQEAIEQNLKKDDFVNILKATPLIELPELHGYDKSGKEKRRERRKQKRKINKFKK